MTTKILLQFVLTVNVACVMHYVDMVLSKVSAIDEAYYYKREVQIMMGCSSS